MGLARFMVKDAYTPGLTEQELDDLISKIHGGDALDEPP
jgi:hypothetical protein